MSLGSLAEPGATARPAKQKRFFSVVIPLYNKEQSISIALTSVLNQTHEAFEIVVIDDGSTDRSASVVAAVRDHRIRLVRQPNGGVSVARNAGVRHARADYIAFLDADDYWQPDFLETIDRLIDMNPAAGLFGTAVEIEQEDGQIVRRKLEPGAAAMPPGQLHHYFRAAAFGGGPPIGASSVCISRKAFEAVGGFKPGVTIGEDHDMFARLALRYPVMFTPEPKAVYRTAGENRALRGKVPLTPWVFHDELERLIASGELPAEIANDVIEHAASEDFFIAIANRMNPDGMAVLSFLRGIKTKAFWRKKLLVELFVCLPFPVRKAVVAARRNLRMLIGRAAVRRHA